MNGLDWITNVHVNGIYKFEDSYHLQAIVKVKKKRVRFGHEWGERGFIQFKLEAIQAFRGCKIGEKFSIGKSLSGSLSYLTSGMKFKDAENGIFDYTRCN